MKKYIWLIFPLLILIINIFFVSFATVKGVSMSPNLKNNEIVIYKKNVQKINRFDIVLVRYNNTKYIKRVIGLPNETIEYKQNKLYIDGVLTNESFITPSVITYDFFKKTDDNFYLVLGDNRENSIDSRTFGLVSSSNIIGKIIFNK